MRNKLFICLSHLNILCLGSISFTVFGIQSACSYTLPDMVGALGCSVFLGLVIIFISTNVVKIDARKLWPWTLVVSLIYALWGHYYHEIPLDFIPNSITQTATGLGVLFVIFVCPLLLLFLLGYTSYVWSQISEISTKRK